jgi:predicted dehydrogenase
MWRFYRIVPEMNPRTIDWALFLGQGFDVDGPIGPTVRECPFDSRLFAQWRCASPFSAGPFSDLLVHPTTKLLAASGLRFPSKVTGAGGLYQERDGRDVPDLAFIAAEFPEGCQMQLTASTLSNYPVEDVIRGRQGTLKFTRGAVQLFADNPERASGFPARLEAPLEPSEVRESLPPRNETESLWRDFLDCVARRDRQTLCPPELGAAALTVTALGWESCRRGQAVAWNRDRRVSV